MHLHFLYTTDGNPTPPPQAHEFDELLFCLSGQSVLTVNGLDWPLNAGSVACIPAGTPHGERPVDTRAFGVMLFSRETGVELDGFRILWDRDASLCDLFRMALNAQGRPGTQAFVSALGAAILAKLQSLDAVCPAPEPSVRPNTSTAVRQLRTQIRSRFSDPYFDLNQAIAATGYSTGHLRRAFREEIGWSPHEELRRIRMMYARGQLLNPAAGSVEKVCFSSGFLDSCQFSRQFKRIFGCSPTEFQHTGSMDAFLPGVR